MTKPSRVGTSKNLAVGGSYDLLMIKFEGTFPEGVISFGLYDTPMKITGIQKVAQVFLCTLMTTRGSDPFYPNKGTKFPELAVGSNQLTDDTTYLSDIADSVKDAEAQTIVATSISNIDPSSILAKAEVIGLDKVPEGVIMYIGITTAAGVTASISMPFPEFGLGEI